jgi:hypothetical protein
MDKCFNSHVFKLLVFFHFGKPKMSSLTIVVVLLILIFSYNVDGDDEQHESCSRRCGVHNISHPFRLKDSPKECGDERYNLSCEDNNQLILYYGSFGKYYVQSINYNNFTIRLLDFNSHGYSNYSIPPHPLGFYNFTSRSIDQIALPYRVFGDYIVLLKSMLYVTCPKHVQYSSGIYFDAACMNISNSYEQQKGNYIVFGDKSLLELGLEDGCRIELMFLTSWPFKHGGNNNISCTDIRGMMFYGFELSWLNSLCKDGWYSDFLDYNNQRRCCAPSGNYLQTTSSKFFSSSLSVFVD